jgi:hypothetical protein
MTLLRASQLQPGDGDRVFRYSRWRAALLALVIFSFGVGWLYFGSRQPAGVSRYASYYVGAVVLLGLLTLQRYITARFRASNWLVRQDSSGLYVRFRSYLNYALADVDETVLFIGYQEIRSARLVIEHTKFDDAQGHRATNTTRFVELDVTADVTPLAKALSVERARPAPSEKHWYGTSRTLYNHYPVQVERPSFVRVQWSATPRASKFLEAMKPAVEIAPPLSLSEDLTTLAAQPPEHQQQQLVKLVAAGQTIVAVYLARRLYGLDLTTAKTFVDQLRQSGVAGCLVTVMALRRGASHAAGYPLCIGLRVIAADHGRRADR